MEELIMKKEITYTEINGINSPNLHLPEQPKVSIGKYGQIQLNFFKKRRWSTYTTLLTESKLAEHLSATDEEACSMVDTLIAELAKKRGINENLKASNPLLWAQEMNNCKVSDEEIALREVIYRWSPLLKNFGMEAFACKRTVCLICWRLRNYSATWHATKPILK